MVASTGVGLLSAVSEIVEAAVEVTEVVLNTSPEGVGTTTTFLGVMATCGGSEGVAEVVVELTTVATVGTATCTEEDDDDEGVCWASISC